MTDFALGVLGLALVAGPGIWWAVRQRLPAPTLFGLLLGPAVLVTLVLIFQLCSLPLNRWTLGFGWLLVGLSLAFASRTTPPGSLLTADSGDGRQWQFWLCALPTIVAVIWRANAHPLFGFDTDFRWGFLAELMVREHSLWFYPPVTPADFAVYAWPDGIPPLVSSTYVALYLLAGGVHPTVTGPFTAVQFIVLLAATTALTRRCYSPRAAGWTLALLGVTPLAAWACAMGQETGFTALGLVGLLLYLPRDRSEETWPRFCAAGLAAATLMLAREYGWMLAAFGFGLGCWRRLSWRGLLVFAGVTLFAAAPWYVRNALRTGNPLYNLSPGGLLPVNASHAALMAIYRENFPISQLVRTGLPAVFLSGAVVIAAGLLGLRRGLRQAGAVVTAAVLVVALWLASVPYTAAGFTYASRVLSPALALGAVLGGAWLARHLPTTRRQIVAFVVLGTLSLYSAAAVLVLPDRLSRRPVRQWLTVDDDIAAYHRGQAQALERIAALVRPARLLALGGNNSLQRLSVDAVPPWSPDAAIIFDRRLAPAIVWSRLHASGLRYVLISRGEFNRRYLESSPAFAAAGENDLHALFANDEFVLFEIVATRPVAPSR